MGHNYMGHSYIGQNYPARLEYDLPVLEWKVREVEVRECLVPRVQRELLLIDVVAILHGWPYCAGGHIAQVDILPRRDLGTAGAGSPPADRCCGHIAQAVILHGWPYRADGQIAFTRTERTPAD